MGRDSKTSKTQQQKMSRIKEISENIIELSKLYTNLAIELKKSIENIDKP